VVGAGCAERMATVSLLAIATVIASAAVASAQSVTVTNQAELDALIGLSPSPAGTISVAGGDALTLNAVGAVTFSDTIALAGASFAGPYGSFVKAGTGRLTFDNADIDGGSAYVYTGEMVFTGTNSVDYFAVGSATGADGTVSISSGRLNVGVALQVGDFGGVGTVNQTGGIVTVKADCSDATRCGSLNIGNQGGTGTYNISAGELNLFGSLHSIGRNTSTRAAGDGTLNISGGVVSLVRDTDSDFYNPGDLIIGDRDEGGSDGESSGTIHQTGGVLRIGPESHIYLAGYGSGTYDLLGGTFEIGGSSLVGHYNGTAGAYDFNLGGGVIKVTGSKLVTDVNATLLDDTLSGIDVGTFGADWNGKLEGNGALAKTGSGLLTIGDLSETILGLAVLDGDVKLKGSKNFAGSTAIGITSGSTLHVAGDFTLGSSGALGIGIDDAGRSGAIEATGNIALNGTVAALPVSGYVVDHDYVIATAGGTASFANAVVVENFAFLSANLSLVDTNSIVMTLTQDADFTIGARTRNQNAAAGALDSTGGGGDLFNAISLLSSDDAPAAFDAISGELHAAAVTSLLNDSLFLRDAVLGRLQYPSKASAPTVSMVSGYAEGERASSVPFPGAANVPETDRNTLWTQAFGAWGHTDGNDNSGKIERSGGGVLVGYDRSFGHDWLVGVAGGYSRSSFNVDDRASSGDSDNYHLLAYAGGSFAALNLRLGAGYTWNEIDTTRNVLLGDFFEQVKGDYSAGTTQLFAEISHDFAVRPATTLSPFAGLAYVHLSTDGHGETGGSSALEVDGSNQSLTYGTLGLRADHKVILGDTAVTLQGAAAWQHAWGDVAPVSTVAFAGGDAFQVTGAPIARDALLLQAGFDVDITAGAKFGLFYAGQLASDAADNSVQGRLSVTF
jgi:outer membrane autotransporter protein